MAASYPTSVKTWTPVADNTDDVMAAHVNEAYEEILAVETDLLASKSDLADNLTTMGRTAASTESLSALVAKVLDISDEATMVAADLANGKTGYSGGALITGTRGMDSYIKALLHFNGANDGTVFTDETGKTWTANGNAKTSTAQRAYGTASVLFDDTGDYLSTPDHADFHFDTGDFTIEAWARLDSITSSRGGFFSQGGSDNDVVGFYHVNNSVRFIAVSGGVVKAYFYTDAILAANRWHHVAVVRNGSNVYIFVDGVSQSLTVSTAISTNALPDLATPVYIGSRVYDGLNDYDGYIDEFRVSKGIARWTADFAPGAPYGG